MPKFSALQSSFNGGEFTDLLKGQVNLAKRPEALEICQNMLPLKQGPVTRRGGSKYINQVKSENIEIVINPPDPEVILIPFTFSTDDTYMIEMGVQYFRFYKDGKIVTDSSTVTSMTSITQADPVVVTYSGADNFSNGDFVYFSGIHGMFEISEKVFKIANVDTGANTFELQDRYGNDVDGTNFTAFNNGGTVGIVYELANPFDSYAFSVLSDFYDGDLISRFDYVQSADVLYLFHQYYQTRTLTRIADDDWTLNTLVYEDGPYLDTNTTSTTLTLSATSGTVTVTASGTTGINLDHGFYAEDVGRIIRWQDPAGDWTWLTITAFTSTTVVTARIDGPNASATTATTSWRLGVWSDTTGWPAHGTFFQDRLCFGGGRYEFLDGGTPSPNPSANRKTPDRVDLSKTGGYAATFVLMAPTEVDGTVSDDNALNRTLPSREVNAIRWMIPDSQGLIIGTTSQEWALRVGSNNEVVTPSNARTEPLSSFGNSEVRPVTAESGIIACSRSRQRIYDLLYSFDLDKPKPRDISIAAEHLTSKKIKEMAYQQNPLNVVWLVTDDGTLLSLTYYPDQNVFAWARHILGGTSDSDGTQAQVFSIAVLPSPDGTRDEVWLQVKRYINGSTRYYIEKLEQTYESIDNLEDYIQQDASYSYAIDATLGWSATGAIGGLHHLEGETVQVMVDSKEQNDLTVTNGTITLDNGLTGSNIQIGYSNTWIVKTMEPEAGARDGTAQGKTKRINYVSFKFLNTLGFKYGTGSAQDEYDFNTYTEYDLTPTLFSGNTEFLTFPDGYNQEGQIYMTDNSPYPVTVLSITYQLNTQDR